ncbi:hypothetical protein MFLAVUS_004570 [Mucor flavus]|uniref:Albumin 1 n=1 Tax=Mucor flavus TaxID=439312 RepID=A0ABP9YW90_9FUNG
MFVCLISYIQAAAVLEGGRPCIVGLHDCPDTETCIIQEANFGHCGKIILK